MSTPSPSAPALASVGAAPLSSRLTTDRARRRARIATSVQTLVSVGLLVDLVLVGHLNGEEIWGPITAACAVLVGALSLAYLAARGRNGVIRLGLIVLWLTIAFFGFGGYNSHRMALPDGTVDSRPRPPLAPLVFSGMGIAGALFLRSGTKGT